jgi:nucleotide-binding universal stress UspA family protein
MSYPFRRILSPVDFDDNSLAALDVAAQIARDNDGLVLLAHVVPMIIPPTGRPVYIDLYKVHEDLARAKLDEIAQKRLRGVKHEILTKMGHPAGTILSLARHHATDLIVMATHGRRGFSRVLLGSIAEMVLREAPCPVLSVRRDGADKNLVARWMSPNPVTARPDEKIAAVEERMHGGDFRSVPVVRNGHLVGLITDREVRGRMDRMDATEVKRVMNEDPETVTPTTPLHDAVRIIFEHKIDSLPVVEEGKLTGMITSSDILRAFLEQE